MKLAITAISGMAPRCKLVSLKVLDGEGGGLVSNLIAALDYMKNHSDICGEEVAYAVLAAISKT